MTKKSAAKLESNKPVCKEEGCFESPNVKGFCRLHFLKAIAGKMQGNQVPQGKLELVQERRSQDRFQGLEPEQPDELMAAASVSSLSELDTDLSDVNLVGLTDDPTFTGRKAG
jgi:hypothetical protein